MTAAQDLVALLDGTDSLGIVCHDNPDPDCLASALALNAIAATVDIESVDILYGGDVSHQQNRVFINLFEIEMEPLDAVDLDGYERLAFVDHSLPGQNTEAPRGTDVDIVVDHHPLSTEVSAQFVDRRVEYGATTTIFVEYLRELDVEMTKRLASALLFALHRERLDYVRNPTIEEYSAAGFLYPHVDQQYLDEMYGAAFTRATLEAIGEAIGNRTVRGSSLVSGVGRTTERDALPQAADYLLNLEGVNTVLVFGLVDDAIHMSARSIDPRVDVGEVLGEAFSDVGSTGGHQDMAGAQLPLGILADAGDDTDTVVELISNRVRERFFDTMHLEEEQRSE